MKTFFKLLLIPILFVGVEKLTRTQTDGFRLGKTQSDYPFREEWVIENNETIAPLLDQNFHFLGSGVQCYAFIGDDGETVLKVFKHYHLGPTSTQLKKVPLPNFMNKWRTTLLKKRQQRIESIFSSALIAQKELSSQTGVFHLNLNKAEGDYPTVNIYDRIGIRYDLDLNSTPFLLQKKADLLFTYLNAHKDETKSIIDSLFACIENRSKMGIVSSDPVVHKNFGILQGNVIEIDIGSFTLNPYIQNSLFSKRELFYQTLELKDWILSNTPELHDYFEQTLLRAIRT